MPTSIHGQPRGLRSVSGDIRVRVDSYASDRLKLSWDAVAGATHYEIWLAPSPPVAPTRAASPTVSARAGDGDASLPEKMSISPALAEPHQSAPPRSASPRAPRARVHLLDVAATPRPELSLGALAADTHVFLEVVAKAKSPPTGFQSKQGLLHVHLPTGAPSLPVRAQVPAAGIVHRVYGVARDIIGLTIRQVDLEPGDGGLQGNRGADWQSGDWIVTRANGQPIDVKKVSRWSVPTGQGGLELGFGAHSEPTVHVDHRLYLQLGQAIGSSEVLRIQHRGKNETDLEVLAPYSDDYLETPSLQVNQVGYHPGARHRYAYVYGFLGDGGPLPPARVGGRAEVLVEPAGDGARRAVLRDLPVALRAASTNDVDGAVGQIDLSRLPAAGGRRYRVKIPGVGVSFPTTVSHEASFLAFYTVARGLYHNRWCGDLRAGNTDWSRPADHCSAYFVGGRTEGFFPEEARRKSRKPVRGGHHDAGDFDIRPMHVLVAQYLMRAYEASPSRFTDGQLHLPESGNGIPDLLDEALWSVAGWEALQNADGSVRVGVEGTSHPRGYYFAHEDQLDYFAYDGTAAHTAYVAGLMAQAAYLVAPFDAHRADTLRRAAKRAYDYARKNSAPPTYLAYAASELTRASKDARAGFLFERLWNQTNKHGRGLFDHMQTAERIYPGSILAQHPAMPDFAVGYLRAGKASPEIAHISKNELTRRADEAARRLLSSAQPHRSARPPGHRPDWGMDSSQGRYLDGIYQRLALGGVEASKRQSYVDALSLAADYILGCNPAGVSYVTGLGSRPPRQPLHLDSIAFQESRHLPPVPGLVVYGPVEGMPRAPYYQPVAQAFHPAFGDQPLAVRLADAVQAVNMSEFSVWETGAPTALLFASLAPNSAMKPWSELAPTAPGTPSPLPPVRE